MRLVVEVDRAGCVDDDLDLEEANGGDEREQEHRQRGGEHAGSVGAAGGDEAARADPEERDEQDEVRDVRQVEDVPAEPADAGETRGGRAVALARKSRFNAQCTSERRRVRSSASALASDAIASTRRA